MCAELVRAYCCRYEHLLQLHFHSVCQAGSSMLLLCCFKAPQQLLLSSVSRFLLYRQICF